PTSVIRPSSISTMMTSTKSEPVPAAAGASLNLIELIYNIYDGEWSRGVSRSWKWKPKGATKWAIDKDWNPSFFLLKIHTKIHTILRNPIPNPSDRQIYYHFVAASLSPSLTVIGEDIGGRARATTKEGM